MPSCSRPEASRTLLLWALVFEIRLGLKGQGDPSLSQASDSAGICSLAVLGPQPAGSLWGFSVSIAMDTDSCSKSLLFGGYPGASVGKESTCQRRRRESIPGGGGSLGGGNGHPLQCFCLENPMDRRAWWATVCQFFRAAKNRARLSTHRSTSGWFRFSDDPDSSVRRPRGSSAGVQGGEAVSSSPCWEVPRVPRLGDTTAPGRPCGPHGASAPCVSSENQQLPGRQFPRLNKRPIPPAIPCTAASAPSPLVRPATSGVF